MGTVAGRVRGRGRRARGRGAARRRGRRGVPARARALRRWSARRSSPLLVTAEDHSVRTGLGASVAEWMADNGRVTRLRAPRRRRLPDLGRGEGRAARWRVSTPPGSRRGARGWGADASRVARSVRATSPAPGIRPRVRSASSTRASTRRVLARLGATPRSASTASTASTARRDRRFDCRGEPDAELAAHVLDLDADAVRLRPDAHQLRGLAARRRSARRAASA